MKITSVELVVIHSEGVMPNGCLLQFKIVKIITKYSSRDVHMLLWTLAPSVHVCYPITMVIDTVIILSDTLNSNNYIGSYIICYIYIIDWFLLIMWMC